MSDFWTVQHHADNQASIRITEEGYVPYNPMSRIRELVEGLERLEFVDCGRWYRFCPVCYLSEATITSVGHDARCWLSALIKRGSEK